MLLDLAFVEYTTEILGALYILITAFSKTALRRRLKLCFTAHASCSGGLGRLPICYSVKCLRDRLP